MKTKYQIKANRELFARWFKVGTDISRLNIIVQNDQELAKEDILVWLNQVTVATAELYKLQIETMQYIENN